MAVKTWCVVASLFTVALMLPAAAVVSGESRRDFRRENGLQAYVPPDGFLRGYFIAREKNPAYLFGPVRDFAGALGGTTTWLIEDMELERVEAASAAGRKIEYSLYLEAASPDRVDYWVFVVLPYESAQAWYDARRAYHGKKAEEYYGTTRNELDRALSRGLTVTGELRFCIDDGKTSLQVPEEAIMSRYHFQPVFDLRTGRKPDPAAATE
jgi:hypothetical protein